MTTSGAVVRRTLWGIAAIAALLPQLTLAQERLELNRLVAGDRVAGFRAAALYLDDADRPIGGRFLHEATGFTLDLLRIETVPQGFIWVNSFPTSDMGEPHTQEHLLLGKGTVGKAVATLDDMSLTRSSAFTQQLRTAYHFHTVAGPDVYFDLFERRLDALLHPDYTDEEIRREVRNFGVVADPASDLLRLEEKGTVYNEMVSSFDRPFTRMFDVLGEMLFGPDHPQSFSSGGTPEGIRAMQPADIRRFHADHYFLANMGMVAALPSSLEVGGALARFDAILRRLEPEPVGKPSQRDAEIGRPVMAEAGTIRVVTYPHANAQQPGMVALAWPPTRSPDLEAEVLLGLFLDNLAGDPTTNLYKRFIDARTRQLDVGATGVFNFVDDDPGRAVYVGLVNVKRAYLEPESLQVIRDHVLDEIDRIAAFADGSEQLAEFNRRIADRLVELRRRLSKFMNSPPGFGFRGTGSAWPDHLRRLNREGAFRKAVTMRPVLANVEALLAGTDNFWPDRLAQWRLTGVTPYATAAVADPQLQAQATADRQARVADAVGRLKQQYGVADEQEVLRRYQAAYDEASEAIERRDRQLAAPRFLERPPLSLDEELQYVVDTLPEGPARLSASFETMTSATIGIALDLRSTPADELLYLAALPTLLTEVGVVRDGTPLSYEQMRSRLRREILALDAYFSTNFATGRAELTVRAAGNDAAEAEAAVGWMRSVLAAPDWRPENLSRLREVVDQSLSRLRNTMLGREEAWVGDPAAAYRRQDDPLLLATESFLTRTHNLLRLRWLLKDPGSPDVQREIAGFFGQLTAAGDQAGRAELEGMIRRVQEGDAADDTAFSGPAAPSLTGLSDDAKALARDAIEDLQRTLPELPDETLAEDWRYLIGRMHGDLLVPPATALARLDGVRQRMLRSGGARLFVIASTPTRTRLNAPIGQLLAILQPGAADGARYDRRALVDARVAARSPAGATPVYVGLVNPNVQGGVILNSAPGATYDDTDRQVLLDYLASKLYAGGGAHSIFTQTIGAGLAYSNGLGGSPANGRQSYYAERTPELPQTLGFVIERLHEAPRDLDLVEYAVGLAFAGFRSPNSYESRGEAMAANLVDGITPDVVARFHRAILDLRATPDLSAELYRRMDQVYGRVLPGYSEDFRPVEGGVYFVIGPDRQLELYEAFLRSRLGDATRLTRLYPRDFWMAAPADPVP